MNVIILLPVRRARTGAWALAAGLLLAGCGGPERATGPAAEAGELVAALERALAAGDAARICSELLSPGARRLAGGDDCPRRLGRETARLRRPSLEPLAITLRAEGRVSVRVKARAEGAGEAEDTLELVPTEPAGRLRIASLSG